MAPTLTDTTSMVDSLNDITFDAVDAAKTDTTKEVRIIFPTAATDFRITTAIIPRGSKFHPGAHWHEDYDEVIRVIKGRIRARLDDKIRIVGPEDGDLFIKRGVVHDFWRADFDAKPGEGDDEEVVVEEHSEPVDGSKELFFRTVFSASKDSAAFGWKVPVQMLLTLLYADNYMEFVPMLGSGNWYLTHGLYTGVVRPLAWVLGLRPFYDEYTPERLRAARMQMEEKWEGKKRV